MVFDANQQKAAFDENLTVDGVNTNVKVIQDFPSVSSLFSSAEFLRNTSLSYPIPPPPPPTQIKKKWIHLVYFPPFYTRKTTFVAYYIYFAFLHTKILPKRGLLLKARLCSQGEQILFYYRGSHFGRETTIFKELLPLKEYPFSLN